MCKRRVCTFVSFSTHSPGSSPRGRGEEEEKEKEKKKGKEEEEEEEREEEGDSAPQYVILV